MVVQMTRRLRKSLLPRLGSRGNLSSTDTDVQAALDTIDGLSLGGGGGGATPDRIVLADAVGVSNTAGPHEIALTEAMVARQWLTFFAFTTAGASPDGIGYLLSDDILALTAEATAPTDAENALPVVTSQLFGFKLYPAVWQLLCLPKGRFDALGSAYAPGSPLADHHCYTNGRRWNRRSTVWRAH